MGHADEYFMRQALRLARKGMGKTYPNPMVGAVIAKAGTIIGCGFHKKAGLPHAEIEAILSCRESVVGSVLYVNLEPCCHTGKTPPCVKAIIGAGIARVVCSTADPNLLVHGQGIQRLRSAGIQVDVGLNEQAARLLNEQFFTFNSQNRPFVALKYAASLDGKLAGSNGDSKWITNEAARAYSRKLRGRYQAILVGANTVIADDPHLGTRSGSSPDPMRIILDSTLRLPIGSQVLRNKNVLLATTAKADASKKQELIDNGFEIASLGDDRVSLPALLAELKKRDIISVLVEGGGKVLGDFIDHQLADRVYGFYAPVLIGGKNAVSIYGRNPATTVGNMRMLAPKTRRFGDNILIEGAVLK